jgi:hypothetical protein
MADIEIETFLPPACLEGDVRFTPRWRRTENAIKDTDNFLVTAMNC